MPSIDLSPKLPDSCEELDELDWAIDFENLASNQRIAVRYCREDIIATLKLHKLFVREAFVVKLLNISSKGAAIKTRHAMSQNTKVTLGLTFHDGRHFDIAGLIVRCKDASEYGIRFEHINNLLAEHLLDTQTDLQFS